jgi:hypothetical protein
VTTLLNAPAWSPGNPKTQGAFHEVWFCKLNDPVSQRALWLRFVLLISGNGFRRVAETWAIFSERGANNEVTKVALKQSYDLKSFQASGDGSIRIGECEIRGEQELRLSGQIQSKGRTITWELTGRATQDATFNLVPEKLRRWGMVRNSAVTVSEDMVFNGFSEIDGTRVEWKNAAGMQSHLSGPNNGHSWIWGHSNLFVDERGTPVPFVFEGLTARAWLPGSIPSPQLSSFFFIYESRAYVFNTTWDAIRAKSKHSLTDWEFQVDRGDISFRGKAHAEIKDFTGLTYEDTRGSLLYCANSKLTDLQIHVYRNDKLEHALYSKGMAAMEVVTREKSPYVPLLI